MKSGMRLFGHPLHPMLSHFPMAFLIGTTLWDGLALAGIGPLEPEAWWDLAFWNLVFGLVMTLPTAVAGSVDYVFLEENRDVYATANRHVIWVGLAVICYLASLMLRKDPLPDTGVFPWAAVGTSGLGLLFLVIGGHHGGALVYRHGIGKN